MYALIQASLFSFDSTDRVTVVDNFLNLERAYVEKLQILVEVCMRNKVPYIYIYMLHLLLFTSLGSKI